jgi:hypothetical protein
VTAFANLGAGCTVTVGVNEGAAGVNEAPGTKTAPCGGPLRVVSCAMVVSIACRGKRQSATHEAVLSDNESLSTIPHPARSPHA